MTLVEFYTSIGMEYDIVLTRLRKEERIKKYLKQIVNDPAFAELRDAVEYREYDKAFRNAHTIKGMCLNLDLKPMTEAAVELVEVLRNKETQRVKGIFDSLWEQFELTKEKVSRIV